MSYHARIETSEFASLSTTRSRNSELWFINNRRLENEVLGNLAKYAKRYEVALYAFAIEGSHVHDLAHYPKANRGVFHRDLNCSIAKSVMKHAVGYPGGRLWARRYSNEFLPDAEDIEEYFFYVALQPVHDGLVDRLSEYPGYNFFNDAINGITRKFKIVRWKEYNDALRWDPNVKISSFTDIFELSYKRLPGYENLTQAEYRKVMLKKLEVKRKEAIAKRNKPCMGAERLKQQIPGTPAKNPKKSKRYDHRPRILCVCPKRRRTANAWYFNLQFDFKEASAKYRSGDLETKFPPGTFKPPIFTCKALPAEL